MWCAVPVKRKQALRKFKSFISNRPCVFHPAGRNKVSDVRNWFNGFLDVVVLEIRGGQMHRRHKRTLEQLGNWAWRGTGLSRLPTEESGKPICNPSRPAHLIKMPNS